MKILVLCTGNSCRSQMAEAYLRHFAGRGAEVFSAGVEAHGLNPRMVKVMAEDGFDVTSHTSDIVDKYLGMDFDLVFTVCDNAQERCPVFPGKVERRVHYNFPDPAKASGTEEEILAQFRAVRDQIRAYCRDLVA